MTNRSEAESRSRESGVPFRGLSGFLGSFLLRKAFRLRQAVSHGSIIGRGFVGHVVGQVGVIVICHSLCKSGVPRSAIRNPRLRFCVIAA